MTLPRGPARPGESRQAVPVFPEESICRSAADSCRLIPSSFSQQPEWNCPVFGTRKCPRAGQLCLSDADDERVRLDTQAFRPAALGSQHDRARSGKGVEYLQAPVLALGRIASVAHSAENPAEYRNQRWIGKRMLSTNEPLPATARPVSSSPVSSSPNRPRCRTNSLRQSCGPVRPDSVPLVAPLAGIRC